MKIQSAISAINQAGALLVFPIANRKDPRSLWSHFFPRSEMKWEWDEGGDNRVGRLWELRSALSTTRKVVYTKWYQGRATYFSRPVFTCLLRALNADPEARRGLSVSARKILEILEGESPLSTKQLKSMAGLRGREQESAYERALKELWSRLLIVAYGEVEEGAFPSLAIGATQVLFEDLWQDAFKMKVDKAERELAAQLGSESLFYKHFLKLRKGVVVADAPAKSARKEEKGEVKKIARVVRFEDLR